MPLPIASGERDSIEIVRIFALRPLMARSQSKCQLASYLFAS